jgi:acyl carrier protein
VLGLGADKLDTAAPLSSLGFDSLMAVQLKNRIETDLSVLVPMVQFIQGPSVDQLAPVVLALVTAAAHKAGGPEPASWEEGSL